MYDLVIIGSGPAGISAALYACRAKLSVLVLGKDDGALATAHRIENYYGLAKPLSGAELAHVGRTQAKALGAVLSEEEVLALSWDGSFLVQTALNDYKARAVLLATGAPRTKVKLPGLVELEGKGVSYCAICDAFFFRGKSVAVLGNGEYAVHELNDLLPHAAKVTLLTDGQPLRANVPKQVAVVSKKLQRLQGSNKLESVVFADQTKLAVDGLFIALGQAAAADLARKVGAVVEGNRIVTDETMQTTVPGLFAAGDCTGGILQISTAVGEGAKAALSIIPYLRK